MGPNQLKAEAHLGLQVYCYWVEAESRDEFHPIVLSHLLSTELGKGPALCPHDCH
jgi:hypothetical protein